MSLGSVEYRKAVEKAKAYDADLRADDPRFNRSVKIISDDYKTVLQYDSAFALKDDCWYYVFTEHNGYHVFHEEDDYVFQYDRLKIDLFKQ